MKKRALISVYDKTGIVEFAKELVKNDFEIVSTSGTAKLLQENGIKVTTVEELTKAPEVLGGRVKTLHPLVFAGLLTDKENPDHQEEVKQFGFELFDLLVVSLYPFEDTIAKPGCTQEEAIEQIDIGGVSLIRAAAKNFSSVSVIVSASQLKEYFAALKSDKIDYNYNLKLASEAFRYIASYDSAISDYFQKLSGSNGGSFVIGYKSSNELRYGENPHQKAALYSIGDNGFNEQFEKLHGKDLSYINIIDIDAAYNLINEFDEPSCAIIKHTNPSGAASADNIKNAYLRAFSCDTVSPFGGIVIVNREMDLQTATEIDKIFTEIIIAPSYSKDAFEFLVKKKNRRLIKYNVLKLQKGITVKELKSVTGGLLVQDADSIVVNEKELKVVTEKKPSGSEMKDMLFAMKVAKHVKSNAVVYVKNNQTVGIGGGQPSRVDSSKIAVDKAKRFGMDLTDCAVASDAFFPFADGLIEAAEAGAKYVIQPGGSVRDEEVIQAANDRGLVMVFTGVRHFKH